MRRTIINLLGILFMYMGFGQTQLSFEEATDTIFETWNNLDKPGIAAGVLKNGEVIYLKGFGSANLETKTPITPQTKFQVDDLSKQFTVLAFLLLEEQGKISMIDDVRKYIPKLPEYSKKISLKHVLNHSTGLNNYQVVKELIGGKLNDVFTHKNALDLIATQKELNFTPGTEFSYRTSDTELTLMAEIIEKASGQSLADFATQYIFKPLQMSNTLFCDDYEMIIPNVAKSYQATQTGFKKRVLNNANAGPTNLYISAQDLAIWYAQFTSTQNGIASTIQKLHNKAVLDNGKTRKDSWGILTLGRNFWHKERGTPAHWQFGLLGGYGANMFFFPEQNIFSFALGNNNQYNGYYAMLPVEPLLKEHYQEPPVIDFGKIKTKKLSLKKLKQFEGNYWDPKGYARRVFVENDTLRFARPEGERSAALVPLSNNTFQMVVESDDVVIFTFDKTEIKTRMVIVSGVGDPAIYETYIPKTYVEEHLKTFTGTFYNKELNTTYDFFLDESQLKAKHLRNGTTSFFPVTENVFRSEANYFTSITFDTNTEGAITGFSIHSDDLKNIEFFKIDEVVHL